MPVSSTAGPDTRIRIRGPLRPVSAAITSTMSTLKDEISVPLITDRPVQRMPAFTSDSGMMGSAARAAGAATSIVSRRTSDRRQQEDPQ